MKKRLAKSLAIATVALLASAVFITTSLGKKNSDTKKGFVRADELVTYGTWAGTGNNTDFGSQSATLDLTDDLKIDVHGDTFMIGTINTNGYNLTVTSEGKCEEADTWGAFECEQLNVPGGSTVTIDIKRTENNYQTGEIGTLSVNHGRVDLNSYLRIGNIEEEGGINSTTGKRESVVYVADGNKLFADDDTIISLSGASQFYNAGSIVPLLETVGQSTIILKDECEFKNGGSIEVDTLTSSGSAFFSCEAGSSFSGSITEGDGSKVVLRGGSVKGNLTFNAQSALFVAGDAVINGNVTFNSTSEFVTAKDPDLAPNANPSSSLTLSEGKKITFNGDPRTIELKGTINADIDINPRCNLTVTGTVNGKVKVFKSNSTILVDTDGVINGTLDTSDYSDSITGISLTVKGTINHEVGYLTKIYKGTVTLYSDCKVRSLWIQGSTVTNKEIDGLKADQLYYYAPLGETMDSITIKNSTINQKLRISDVANPNTVLIKDCTIGGQGIEADSINSLTIDGGTIHNTKLTDCNATYHGCTLTEGKPDSNDTVNLYYAVLAYRSNVKVEWASRVIGSIVVKEWGNVTVKDSNIDAISVTDGNITTYDTPLDGTDTIIGLINLTSDAKRATATLNRGKITGAVTVMGANAHLIVPVGSDVTVTGTLTAMGPGKLNYSVNGIDSGNISQMADNANIYLKGGTFNGGVTVYDGSSFLAESAVINKTVNINNGSQGFLWTRIEGKDLTVNGSVKVSGAGNDGLDASLLVATNESCSMPVINSSTDCIIVGDDSDVLIESGTFNCTGSTGYCISDEDLSGPKQVRINSNSFTTFNGKDGIINANSGCNCDNGASNTSGDTIVVYGGNSNLEIEPRFIPEHHLQVERDDGRYQVILTSFTNVPAKNATCTTNGNDNYLINKDGHGTYRPYATGKNYEPATTEDVTRHALGHHYTTSPLTWNWNVGDYNAWKWDINSDKVSVSVTCDRCGQKHTVTTNHFMISESRGVEEWKVECVIDSFHDVEDKTNVTDISTFIVSDHKVRRVKPWIYISASASTDTSCNVYFVLGSLEKENYIGYLTDTTYHSKDIQGYNYEQTLAFKNLTLNDNKEFDSRMGNELYYKTSFNVNPKDMTDVIKCRVTNPYDGSQGDDLCSAEISMKSYLQLLINDTDNKIDGNTSRIRDLCVKLLDYGSAAQEYFGVDTDNLANKDIPGAGEYLTITDTYYSGESKLDKNALNALLEAENAKYRYYGMFATFERLPYVSLVFTPAEGVSIEEATAAVSKIGFATNSNEMQMVTPEISHDDDYIYVRFSNNSYYVYTLSYPALTMGNFKFLANGQEVTFGIGQYMAAFLNMENPTGKNLKAQNLIKAMYMYSAAYNNCI